MAVMPAAMVKGRLRVVTAVSKAKPAAPAAPLNAMVHPCPNGGVHLKHTHRSEGGEREHP